jgi:hypothetical protein
MTPNLRCTLALLAGPALVAAGCGTERDTTGLDLEPFSTDPEVFTDTFSNGTDFAAFLGSYLDALSIDTVERHSGQASMKFTIPLGSWAGGAFPTTWTRDLTSYDAVTFWAKASQPTTLDVVGLGNDNTGNSKYEASWSGVELTTTWKKYVVPIPLPSKLARENGLFFFADADPAATADFSIWFDEVVFEKVGTITDPNPTMSAETIETFAGVTRQIAGTQTAFHVGQTEDVEETDLVVQHPPGYFTFTSSDESVATVSEDGVIEAIGSGSATITAKLGDVDVPDTVMIEVAVPDPTGPAPTPPHPPENVISMFSNQYPDSITVTEWSTTWDTADVFDLRIAGDDVKIYEFDSVEPQRDPFAGIDFQQDLFNAEAAGMTHLHLDVWIPGAFFMRVKLVDFGSDGRFTDGRITPCDPKAPELDISEHTVSTLITNPDSADAWSEWAAVDIPLVAFTDFGHDPPGCLRSAEHLAQLVLVVPGAVTVPPDGVKLAYVDNIYFYKK